jgi:2-keto-3-deoxy-L-rhamnonate aldolase RhmA
MHEAVIAIAREGVSPVVRIPANEAWMVKRKYPGLESTSTLLYRP